MEMGRRTVSVGFDLMAKDNRIEGNSRYLACTVFSCK